MASGVASASPEATVLLADENPEKLHYPTWHYRIDQYAGGSLAATLDGLLERLRERKLDAATVTRRRAHWEEQHAAMVAEWDRVARSAQDATPIDARWAALAIGEALPST